MITLPKDLVPVEVPPGQQSRRDAMADAETFSLVYRSESLNREVYGPRLDAEEIARLAFGARAAIARQNHEHISDLAESARFYAWHCSVAAARAAFRAVPGLRG